MVKDRTCHKTLLWVLLASLNPIQGPTDAHDWGALTRDVSDTVDTLRHTQLMQVGTLGPRRDAVAAADHPIHGVHPISKQ